MTAEKNARAIVVRAYTPDQVAEMLQEMIEAINSHCRTQALKGAYKTGGRTSPWRIPTAAIDHCQRTAPRQ